MIKKEVNKNINLDENPSKSDFIKFSILISLTGIAIGSGVTSWIYHARGKREIKKENNDENKN